jgi:hypothetical protein
MIQRMDCGRAHTYTPQRVLRYAATTVVYSTYNFHLYGKNKIGSSAGIKRRSPALRGARSKAFVALGKGCCPCLEYQQGRQSRPMQSTDTFVSVMTKMSVENLRLLPKPFGRRTQPHISQPLQRRMSERLPVGLLANLIRQPSSLRQSSSR